MFNANTVETIAGLRRQFPDTPFLALGQTIWWDEPMKAILRMILDDHDLGGKMVLGVHDTDYFAKINLPRSGHSKYELIPHNDGTTKDLWSAAGEISTLFGSETFPTRKNLVQYHLPIDRLARHRNMERLDFLNETTEAWGWRGLVYTGSSDLIVHCLELKDLEAPIVDMLRWGFDGAQASLVENCCRDEAAAMSEMMLSWVQDFSNHKISGTVLTRLYQELFPKLMELLISSPMTNYEVCCTAHLLNLSPETAHLPRFQFVDLFLNERTRGMAKAAYNAALEGSEIYDLDKFGIGAIPFDVITPEIGRGTLRVTLRAIHIDCADPVRIPLKKPINSIQELAEILYENLGDHVSLVGKAVALISMLASEFIFVFNEEGSAYVTRTLQMNNAIRSAGIDVVQHPILRLKYHTWDSLEAIHASLALPDHLASAFGTRTITGPEFAKRWHSVVDNCKHMLQKLASISSPRQSMEYLASLDGKEWQNDHEEYDRLKDLLVANARAASEIQAQVDSAYVELAKIKAAIVTLERQKGEHFRTTPSWDEQNTSKRAEFNRKIDEQLENRRRILLLIKTLKFQRWDLERSQEVTQIRSQIDQIELKCLNRRLEIVRNAILTVSSLEHTDHRPSAWWLPMVDHKGGWFQKIAATTEAYLQPL